VAIPWSASGTRGRSQSGNCCDQSSIRNQHFLGAGPPRNQFLEGTDSNHLEVHDLANEKVQCRVDEIIVSGKAVIFFPDTLLQARSEGYDTCGWCMGGSSR
jgi:hypothetical protein